MRIFSLPSVFPHISRQTLKISRRKLSGKWWGKCTTSKPIRPKASKCSSTKRTLRTFRLCLRDRVGVKATTQFCATFPNWSWPINCCWWFLITFLAGTPYAAGFFRAKLVLGKDFPQTPPKAYFLTKIFHPNVAANGEICVNTLKKDWKPDLGIKHILLVSGCYSTNIGLRTYFVGQKLVFVAENAKNDI